MTEAIPRKKMIPVRTIKRANLLRINFIKVLEFLETDVFLILLHQLFINKEKCSL